MRSTRVPDFLKASGHFDIFPQARHIENIAVLEC
jgi:hypothetical protein